MHILFSVKAFPDEDNRYSLPQHHRTRLWVRSCSAAEIYCMSGLLRWLHAWKKCHAQRLPALLLFTPLNNSQWQQCAKKMVQCNLENVDVNIIIKEVDVASLTSPLVCGLMSLAGDRIWTRGWSERWVHIAIDWQVTVVACHILSITSKPRPEA